MPTKPQVSGSRRTRLTRSVEIQHGRRGVGLMLRRGLHGAKNWVLEPDEDGLPRTPMAKCFRALVVLLPVLIVLSAVTGGPERGGQQIGLGQAILFSLVVTLVGLGYLSARERRLGREEPWSELPPIGTDGDEVEPETLVDPAPESPTKVLENVQVSDPESSNEVVTPSDIPGESDQTPQIASEMATQVVTVSMTDTPRKETEHRPFVQVKEGDQGTDGHTGQAVTPAVTPVEAEGINHHNSDPLEDDNPTISLIPAKRGGHPVTVSLEKETASQVRDGDQVATGPTPDPTESPRFLDTFGDIGSQMTTPGATFAEVATTPVQESLFPQVIEDGSVVTQVVSPPVATTGPYEVTTGPIADDWWLTKPDEPLREDAEPTPEVAAETAEEADAPLPEEAIVEPDFHPAVMRYRALRTMPDVADHKMAEARDKAAEWARREIAAKRQSQRSAAEILGVSKTTVANWLGSDPWAEVDVE